MFWQIINSGLKATMFEERLRQFNIPVKYPREQSRRFNYYSFKDKDRLNVQYIVSELEKSFCADTDLPPTKKRKLCLLEP